MRSLYEMNDLVSLVRYSELLILQERVNQALKCVYETNRGSGREHLGELLVNEVERIVNKLNAEGWRFGRCSYGGDVNFENSEQIYSDGKEMGDGVILSFCGFSCQVSWAGKDKYQ